jgi:hypothetical protein
MAYAFVIRKEGVAGGNRTHWIQKGAAWQSGDSVLRRAQCDAIAAAEPNGPWEVLDATKDQYWQAHGICWSVEIAARLAEEQKQKTDYASARLKLKTGFQAEPFNLTNDEMLALEKAWLGEE